MFTTTPSRIPFNRSTPAYAVICPNTGDVGLLDFRHRSGLYRVQIHQNVFRNFRRIEFLTEEEARKMLPGIGCEIYPGDSA